ncbi:MAG: ATP-binding protein [Myxococcota bacterium]
MTLPDRLNLAFGAEPFSPEPGELRPIRSREFDQLTQVLERYVDGAVAGRSFLIAGHRGAGKTTLVLNALQQLVSDRRTAQPPRPRPLVVRIPAPRLLQIAEALVPAAPPRGDGADSGQPREEDAAGRAKSKTDATELVIDGLTVGLFHAVSEEVLDAFRRRSRQLHGHPRAEADELTARLRADLSAAPDLGELRDVWERACALDRGVLECGAAEPGASRGIEEISAIWTALQAYQRVIGKTKNKRGGFDEAGQKDELKIKKSPAPEEASRSSVPSGIADAVAALATGAAAAGVLWEPLGHGIAVATGALLGVGALKTLEWSSSATRERSRKREFEFEEDTGPHSVARLLPRLVHQLRTLGLAPVFVIDELDKVQGLRNRFQGLLGDLKQFISEESFSCFLVDREYYEHVEGRLDGESFPVEHTWFTDRLYVQYRASELRHWLGTVILEPQNSELKADRDVWLWAVLHRSRLHTFSLRRELTRLTDGRGGFAHGVVARDRPHTHEALIQLAIEHVLAQPRLARWLAADPYHAQLAVDALYLPSRLWAQEKVTFVVSPESIGRHMRERLIRSRLAEDQGIVDFKTDDLQLLAEAVGELAGLLCDPPALREALKASRANEESAWDRLPAAIRGTVCELEDAPLRAIGETEFRWRWDAFGSGLPAVETTWITSRLFARYSPASQRAWLGDSLPKAGSEAQESHREIWRWILLHRAGLDPIALPRRLAEGAQHRVAGGQTVIAEPHDPDGEVCAQVAVEHLLASSPLAEWVRAAPHHPQLAIEVLYYPSREMARSGTGSLRVNKDVVRKLLTERLAQATAAGARAEGERFTDDDIDVLTDALATLTSRLAEPSLLVEALRMSPGTEGAPSPWEALPSAIQGILTRASPTLTASGEPFAFIWHRALPPPHSSWASAPRTRGDSLSADRFLIEQVNGNIFDLVGVDLGGLASSFSLVGTSPPYSEAVQALRRLQDARRYADRDADVARVTAYAKLLRTALPEVLLALALATGMERISGGSSLARALKRLMTLARESSTLAEYAASVPEPCEELRRALGSQDARKIWDRALSERAALGEVAVSARRPEVLTAGIHLAARRLLARMSTTTLPSAKPELLVAYAKEPVVETFESVAQVLPSDVVSWSALCGQAALRCKQEPAMTYFVIACLIGLGFVDSALALGRALEKEGLPGVNLEPFSRARSDWRVRVVSANPKRWAWPGIATPALLMEGAPVPAIGVWSADAFHEVFRIVNRLDDGAEMSSREVLILDEVGISAEWTKNVGRVFVIGDQKFGDQRLQRPWRRLSSVPQDARALLAAIGSA